MFKDFGRVITAMVTPFNNEGRLNLSVAQDLAAMLVSSGSDGLVVGGTTGESPVLSKDEKVELFSAVKDAVGKELPVIAGTGSYSTQESIELSKEAQAVGLDGIMLVVPYYNKPSQEGLYQHFKTIAGKINLPIMLYNVPSRTVRNMLPETVRRLAEIENIIAIKEAAGDMDQVSELRRITPADFMIYSGDDSLTLPMLALGAHGVVSVASHLVGKRIQDMIKMFFQGRVLEATAIHSELFPLFKNLFITSNPVPVKTALKLLGYPVGEVKLPLIPANVEEEQTILAMLNNFELHQLPVS